MTSALSRSTENMAFLRGGLEDVWSLILPRASVCSFFGQREERLSDGYSIILLFVIVLLEYDLHNFICGIIDRKRRLELKC